MKGWMIFLLGITIFVIQVTCGDDSDVKAAQNEEITLSDSSLTGFSFFKTFADVFQTFLTTFTGFSGINIPFLQGGG